DDLSFKWVEEVCKLFSIIHFNLVFPTQYLINKCVFFLSKMLIYRHNYNLNIDNKAIRPLDAKRSAIIAMIGVISLPTIGCISCLIIFKSVSVFAPNLSLVDDLLTPRNHDINI